MRGKGSCDVYRLLHDRITPAYAGKSLFYRLSASAALDHPRLCGEKIFVDNFEWGGYGITPAYAGKRRFYFVLCNGFWDHPRLCGEKKLLTGPR